QRTQARTLGRVTVLSNVLNAPTDETLPVASEPRAPSPEVEPRNDPAALNVNRLASTSIEAQQLPLRAGRSASPSAQDSWTWLWGLAGTALVLLLSIMLLLTRPTRRG